MTRSKILERLLLSFTIVSSVLFVASCTAPGGGGGSDGGGGGGGTGGTVTGSYALTSAGQVELKDPSYVNMLFQVQKVGSTEAVSSLTRDNFTSKEDGAAVSVAESDMKVAHVTGQIPYSIKTVLMLDNSLSIGTTNLATLRSAAKTLVAGIVANQQIAVYSFCSGSALRCGFTNNVSTLNAAIDNIILGVNTTDLYGAVVTGVGQWTDSCSMIGITTGALVLFTDGKDTTGSTPLATALSARGDKKVITVGVTGADLDQSVLQQLGNAGCYVGDYSALSGYFQQIQQAITNWANSFYWAYYLSPKRGTNSHTLAISLNGNGNTGTNSTVQGNFSSSTFRSVTSGLFVNDTAAAPNGIDFLALAPGVPATLCAHTYFGPSGNAPSYQWDFSTGAATVVKTLISSTPIEEKVSVVASSSLPGGSTLTVTDTANSLSHVIALSPPMAPVISSVVGGLAQATITWAAVPGATSYNLYYKAGTAVTTTTGTKVAGVLSPNVAAPLGNDAQYAFIVTAMNGVGESAASSVMTAWTSSLPAPTISTVATLPGQATVTWGAVTGATSYNLYYAAGTTVNTTTGTKIAGVISPKVVTGLGNLAQYAFIVTAVNGGGESLPSPTVSAWTTSLEAPTITSISATKGIPSTTQNVSVGWGAVPGATSYILYYAAGTTVSTTSGNCIGLSNTHGTVTGLGQYTHYAFIVTAYNSGGEGPASGIATVTTGGNAQ